MRSTENGNLIHAWEVREGLPKVLPDKNGKRCHSFNPFKYVIQIKKKKTQQVCLGEEEAGISEGRGRKGFPKDKKSRCKDTKARKSRVSCSKNSKKSNKARTYGTMRRAKRCKDAEGERSISYLLGTQAVQSVQPSGWEHRGGNKTVQVQIPGLFLTS